jgi:hypothetical protein
MLGTASAGTWKGPPPTPVDPESEDRGFVYSLRQWFKGEHASQHRTNTNSIRPPEPVDSATTFGNTPMEVLRLNGDFKRFRGAKYYSGHFGYSAYAAVNDGHKLVTSFRHPVTRIYSIYNYWKYNVVGESFYRLDPKDAATVSEAKTNLIYSSCCPPGGANRV